MKRTLIILMLFLAVLGSPGAEAILSLGPGIDLVGQDLGSRGELQFAALGFQALIFTGSPLGFLAAVSFSFVPLGADLNNTSLALGSFKQHWVLDMLWAAGYHIAAGPRIHLLAAAGLHSSQISLVHDTDALQVFDRELALGAGLNMSAHYRLARGLLFTLQLKGAYDFFSYAFFKEAEIASALSLGGSAGISLAF